jgi:mono/diheme cytochrome c family protein
MRSARGKVLPLVLALLGLTLTARTLAAPSAAGKGPGETGAEPADRGRYMSIIAGCNDCHTPGYLLSEGKVPEKDWLTGDRLGWRGPWGTTYAANLRLFVPRMTESQWVTYVRNFRTRPPMPWFNLNRMQDGDLKVLYRFIRHLGPGGEAAPAYVPPGQEPVTPYALFPSPPEPR